MARWGKVNYKELQKLQKRMEKLQKVEFEQFCEAMAKELAARLIAKVIHRTPVGQYNDGTVGGTLRRGWTAGKENTNEKGNVVGVAGKTGFASGLEVTKKGDVYEITVSNNVHYAPYVEYGHRQEVGRFVPAIGKRLKKPWVNGRFMMTISANELQGQAPKIIEKKLIKLLGDVFDGD